MAERSAGCALCKQPLAKDDTHPEVCRVCYWRAFDALCKLRPTLHTELKAAMTVLAEMNVEGDDFNPMQPGEYPRSVWRLIGGQLPRDVFRFLKLGERANKRTTSLG